MTEKIICPHCNGTIHKFDSAYQLWGQYAILIEPENQITIITYSTIEEAREALKWFEDTKEYLKQRAKEIEENPINIHNPNSDYEIYHNAWKDRIFKIVTRDVSKWRTLSGKEIEYEDVVRTKD